MLILKLTPAPKLRWLKVRMNWMIFTLPKKGAKNYPELIHPVLGHDRILIVLNMLGVKKAL